MRALQLTGYGGNDSLRLTEVPRPGTGPGEVLIRVHFAGLNPVDWKTRAGKLRAVLRPQLPWTMGNEVAGEVAAVGPGVSGLSVGDAVFARLCKESAGGFAEYVATDAAVVARKPAGIGMDVAAGVPLVALTAWQCLFEYGEVGEGTRVLVHAGAGAVGRIAIQLAKQVGAVVSTTVSERGRAVAEALGAERCVDYRHERFEEVLGPQDFVLDAVGGDTTARSIRVLRRGGRLCSISAVPEPRTAADLGKRGLARLGYALLFGAISAPLRLRAARAGVDYRFVFMRPDGEQLARIAALIDAGKLRVDIARSYELDDYAAAFADLEHETTSGKLVLRIAGQPEPAAVPPAGPTARD